METRQRVLYTGRVQGVGFRQTTARLARQYPVNGWVRNLPDGRVELLVTGPQSQVEAFLADVATRFADGIRDLERESVDSTEPLSRFEVRW